jgi:hypothetical protein
MGRSTRESSDPDTTAVSVLKQKIEAGAFDVFLCHNSQDKPTVKRIGEQLKQEGVLPWLDEWELRPGLPWQRALERQIESVQSAAVFIGAEGIGPWQHQELDAFLRQFLRRERPVIPVLLPDAPDAPDLPAFLEGMGWVDFRVADPDPLARLLWGITGRRAGEQSILPEKPAAQPPRIDALASRPASPPPPLPQTDLMQVLIGSWQVQITNPFGMVGQMMLQIMPNGVFRGQLPTPMGMTMVEGQCQIMGPGQVSLQGRQFIGFQVMPYVTMIQLRQTAPFQLVGMTAAGEQTIWQKIA